MTDANTAMVERVAAALGSLRERVVFVGGCATGLLLGFSNRWYPEALRTARQMSLPSGLQIFLVDPPCFLATKIEAFYGRGAGDSLASHDLEDVVTLVDGRPEIVEEASRSAPQLRAHLGVELEKLLDNEAFLRALPGHLGPDAATQARLPLLERRLRLIAGRSSREER